MNEETKPSSQSLASLAKRGQISGPDAMLELAHTFPAIATLIGDRWDPERVERLTRRGISTGEFHILSFLLHVWNPNHKWACGRFDLFEALGSLDGHARAAMLEFLKDPWWP